MNILHYALGFPPYRSGGLTKYCIDLINTQFEQGYEVGLLWPGRIKFINNRQVSIKSSIYQNRLPSYEIINPLPVSLDEGIIDINVYTTTSNTNEFEKFLMQLRPDAIHIHTLMGLYREFIVIAKRLGIRVVFTSHDYFGICPKVTLFRGNHTCDNDSNCQDCVSCNQTALSLKKVKIMQSCLYRAIKETWLVKKVRAKHRAEFFHNDVPLAEDNAIDDIESKVADYKMLRQYYLSILDNVDVIHFNSELTKDIYTRYFTPQRSSVINVSHQGIADHRVIRNFTDSKLRITFLSPAKAFKGFSILLQALDNIWSNGYQSFELNIFSQTDTKRPYLNKKDGFSQSELPKIFDNTDLLVAPSIWYETFGFTVLEALSYGVPIILSKNVGAKDLLKDLNFCICEPTALALQEKLISIYKDRNILRSLNKAIIEMDASIFSNSIEDICELYYS